MMHIHYARPLPKGEVKTSYLAPVAYNQAKYIPAPTKNTVFASF